MRTRLARSAVLLTVLGAAVAGLGACSDDAEPESAAPTSSAPAATESATTEPAAPATPFGDNCQVTGTVTGDVSLDLEGIGDSDTDIAAQGPAAFYQLVIPPDTSLSVYAAGKGFKASAVLGVGTDTYGPLNGAAGITAADDGSSASLDVELGTADGAKTVQVVATFTCPAA